MSKRGKKIAVEGVSLDLISNLPSEVITHILDFLPVRDIAKTSVLSRKWRYIWASHPHIKIDYITELSIINKILLQHIGPVLKFSVESLSDVDLSFLYHWLSYLSRNGIKELTLNLRHLSQETCILPFHVFSSPKLIVLNLTHFIFNSPNEHADFSKLTILSFCYVDFGLFRVTSAINTPRLTSLILKFCTKVCNFKICAPKLETLILDLNEDFDLISFEMPEISTVALMGRENICLTELFERCPNISSLYIHALWLRYLVPDAQMERLPLMNIHLKRLAINSINWSDLSMISRIVNLLQNSTALLRLEISCGVWRPNWTQEVSTFLDAADNMNWMLNSLEIVVISVICFSEDELRFIKFLLSRAPRLKKMFVEERVFSDNGNAILKIAKCLLRLPRASSEAEIILEPNLRVAQIPKRFRL